MFENGSSYKDSARLFWSRTESTIKIIAVSSKANFVLFLLSDAILFLADLYAIVPIIIRNPVAKFPAWSGLAPEIKTNVPNTRAVVELKTLLIIFFINLDGFFMINCDLDR